MSMVIVTDLAAEKLKDILREEGKTDSSLRIVVMPGPHGGAQYMLTLEEQAKDEDSVLHINGVQIVIDSDSSPLLEGSEIDYVDGLMRSGFVINNPNFVEAGGGCGSGGGCACGGNCSCGGH
jgi:iron-sulfur cluster assembly accessory protein